MQVPTKWYTLGEVITSLEQVVAEFGETTTYDERYRQITGARYDGGTCANWLWNQDGKRVPACLVGVWLDREGFTDVQQHESVLFVQGQLEGVMPTQAARFLADVQDLQDEGMAWGAAVRQVKARYLGSS